MSISLTKVLPCRTCGADIEATTFESINPTRHPFLQDQLLERTLLRRSCDRCGAPHQHCDRLIWTDLPGKLCVCIVQEHDRPHWARLEKEALRALSVPLREEGPPAVRLWGAQVAIRLVFSTEELREKVICRLAGLDDRVVEYLKVTLMDRDRGVVPVLDGCDQTSDLRFRFLDRDELVTLPRDRYRQAAARTAELAEELPGLFAADATWVHWGRAPH
jgi:CpXC motif protein